MTISDDELRKLVASSHNYTAMILRWGPNRHIEGLDKIIWEHGRRNAELRAKGVMPTVCPIGDGSNITGIAVFNKD